MLLRESIPIFGPMLQSGLRSSQLPAHFCARVAPKHRPHFQSVSRVGQSHPQTSAPHLYAQRNGQLHPHHATVGQELQPCRIESAANKTDQSSESLCAVQPARLFRMPARYGALSRRRRSYSKDPQAEFQTRSLSFPPSKEWSIQPAPASERIAVAMLVVVNSE